MIEVYEGFKAICNLVALRFLRTFLFVSFFSSRAFHTRFTRDSYWPSFSLSICRNIAKLGSNLTKPPNVSSYRVTHGEEMTEDAALGTASCEKRRDVTIKKRTRTQRAKPDVRGARGERRRSISLFPLCSFFRKAGLRFFHGGCLPSIARERAYIFRRPR